MAIKSIIIGVISAIVAIKILQLVFPYKSPLKEKKHSVDERENKFKKYSQWNIPKVLVLFYIYIVILIFIWHKTFLLISFFATSSILNKGIYSIVLQNAHWFIPAIFLGIASSFILVCISNNVIDKLFLKERYNEYALYEKLKSAFDVKRVINVLIVIIAIIASATIIFGIDYYTIFTKDDIIINHFLSFDEISYPYSRVQAVKTVSHFKAPNGNIVSRPHFAIEFDDGVRWTTIDTFREVVPEDDEKIINFVAKKSGKTIQKVEILED